MADEPEGDLTSGAMYATSADRDETRASYNRSQGTIVSDGENGQPLGVNTERYPALTAGSFTVASGDQGDVFAAVNQPGLFSHTFAAPDAAFAMVDFGGALQGLRNGMKMTRAGWNGRGMWIELQKPDKHSKMTLPYIYMRTAGGDLVPWLASQTDMLATDWRVSL